MIKIGASPPKIPVANLMLLLLVIPLLPYAAFNYSPILGPSNVLPLKNNYTSKSPLSFIPNYGQTTNEQILYYAQADHCSWGFAGKGITIMQGDSAIQSEFVNTSPDPVIIPQKVLSGTVNYYIGRDPAKWQTNIPTYGAITYHNVWPGIDLTYEGYIEMNNKCPSLKSTFTLIPGADPGYIRLTYPTADSLSVDSQGQLIVRSGKREIDEKAPIAWQETPGGQVPIPLKYQVFADGKTYGFVVSQSYNPVYPLIIDPTLTYSTYWGETAREVAWDVAVDDKGNIYLTGFTASSEFYTTDPPIVASGNQGQSADNAFITKIDAAGTVVYSSYFGGRANETSFSISVNDKEEVTIVGYTESEDFPSIRPLQEKFGKGEHDGFIVQVDTITGLPSRISYLGGSGDDKLSEIAQDHEGNLYIVGSTTSSEFLSGKLIEFKDLTTNYISEVRNIYVGRIAANGEISYSIFGGGLDDWGEGIAVDSNDNVYLTGSTVSSDFPTIDSLPSNHAHRGGDAFFVKLSFDSRKGIYSTYLGGSEKDDASDIAVDNTGSAYVIGNTSSEDFPVTKNAIQDSKNGDTDTFITKIREDGKGFVYSTYLGGADDDWGFSIKVDKIGRAYIVGQTYSADLQPINAFPTNTFPINTVLQMRPEKAGNAFIAKLAPDGDQLEYLAKLGGSDTDAGFDIALDGIGNIYVVGQTFSGDFWTTAGPLQDHLKGDRDAFIAKVDFLDIVTNEPTIVGSLYTYTLTITNSSLITVNNLVITNPLPIDMEYVNGGTLVGKVISWTISGLSAGSSHTVQFSARAMPPPSANNWGNSEEDYWPIEKLYNLLVSPQSLVILSVVVILIAYYIKKPVVTQPTTTVQPKPSPSLATDPLSSVPNAQLNPILIVTVTKVEADAVLNVFLQAAGKKWTRQHIGSKTYYDLNVHGGVPVWMVQSEMGTATPSGALETVGRAIQDLRPQAVIMCGIAFGLDRDKQKLGDILVARQLQCYEFQKIDRRGKINRGDRTTAAERLLDRFRSGGIDWQGAPIYFGLVLSGEKLVNDLTFRKRLLQIEPEAIGGEMEGVGLYVAARAAKVDWILVKAICDWADGEKNDNAHSLAASNAAQFVLHVVQLGGWGESE